METNPIRQPAGTPTDADLIYVPTGRKHRARWNLAFLISWIGILALPFYNRAEPTVAGFPMFYWFQLFLVIVGAIITWVVYAATPDDDGDAT